ncbi:MAG TPA: hypothetical protein VFV82_13455, partial [Candidatus Binatia bacterium]|nr:hypothetical protein [Candidatus Binatia bacterium]
FHAARTQRWALMTAQIGYAQMLRAIGQALEVIQIQEFEIELAGDGILVRGATPSAHHAHKPGQVSPDQLQAVWGAVPDLAAKQAERSVVDMELCYSRSDIDRLEAEGRARRGTSSAPADASRLSQALRGIGGYLDHKRASLSTLRRDHDSVAAEYQTSADTPMRETFATKDIYDLCVRMYLQRADRGH